jgi:hypothetical protein
VSERIPERSNAPAWVPCEHCDEYYCTIHDMHACDCPCPPVEDWVVDPYSEGGGAATQLDS